MSVVLMGIGVALALPSYRDMVEKRQVTNAAEQLASFVNTAQGISMKRNRDVTIKYKYQDADLWCVGATLDADCTCLDPEAEDYCEIDSQAFVLDNSHTGSLELLHSMGTESEGFYSFEPERGLASGTVLPLTMELRSPSGEFRLNLMVNQVGRVLLCSGDDSHAVPGYGRCPTGQPEEES
jgi:Tfp pilus assembly protein FimT